MSQHLVTKAPRALLVTVMIFTATVAQLLVATLATGLPQFEGKAFGSRLVAYPLMMLLVPAAWVSVRRLRRASAPRPLPWLGFGFLLAPFLVDVTGNTLNLYDTIGWWDDANHLANWFLLGVGVGMLLLRASISPRWALGFLVAGVGALLAVGWELAEWYTFIRHGTELATAYRDTLGDQALGTLGAALAGTLVTVAARRRDEAAGEQQSASVGRSPHDSYDGAP
ncbi:MAG: hypothetical protein ACRDPK_20060 [Carbonactinosporaceae bacterium]